ELVQQSLWAPSTLELYGEFYRRLAEAMGDHVHFVRIAMPAEYGEIGYPMGMTTWLVPDDSAETAFWCGDPYARRDFTDRMRDRLESLDAINAAWGTGYASWDAVSPPEDPYSLAAAAQAGPGHERRRWLDFVDWYQSSWTRFAADATRVVRDRLPGRELILSLGYGGEPVPWGNDQSRHIKMMAEVSATCQSPGDIGYFATRRVSSACRHYGVPYYTEPPGTVDRNREVARMFFDASNGTDTWFDYPQNLDVARDLFARYKEHLTGADPVCDVAFILPSAWWWCRMDWNWPHRTIEVANSLRDRMDYEIIDELMIRDGALENLGIRVAVLCEGDFMDQRTLDSLARWTEEGGRLVIMGQEELTSSGGGEHPAFDSLPADASAANLGEGAIVNVGAQGLGGILGLVYAGDEGAPRVDDEADGILATLLPDRILYYNPTGEYRVKHVELAPEDFPDGSPRPEKWVWDLELPAHSIAAIPLA
ncbi:MAG: family 14 glycosylhydrolase, partial [Armatimonadia bacterium]|nr:family 14 glycosylhydrolase [Armatimonadia bacterium]